jgi:hypothetical protein
MRLANAFHARSRFIVRLLLAGLLTFGGLPLFYVPLLRNPQSLFSFSLADGNLVLYSDRPVPTGAGRQVLQRVGNKLKRSLLYDDRQCFRIFICNERWRQILFFNKDYGAGGVAQFPLTSNVFLRQADVAHNRLISPGGIPVPGTRTFDYFAAHEITHQLTGQTLGVVTYFRLPRWIREGYADYVGQAGQLNYFEARHAFLIGTSDMDPDLSGLYLRFQLLVTYLLDRQHWSVYSLLTQALSQEATEEDLAYDDELNGVALVKSVPRAATRNASFPIRV